ncbi:MAG: GMC family oxidoreductase [Acidimicrobiales bacterium]
MSVDAVVVGSGPGGATAADVLTRAGWSVVIVEKGTNRLLDPSDPSKPNFEFSNDEVKFLRRHFLGPDPIVEPRTFRKSVADGERSYVGEVNSIPSTVGGGGVHADGKVPRFSESDFHLLSSHGPQPGADVADWPITYGELEPYYAECERSIGVAGAAGTNPFAAWRSCEFPMRPGAPMYGALLSSSAATRLGYHPYPAPTAANSVPYRGRPACNNCGFCAFFGCPIHAKGDPIALLTRVMASGRAELLSETFVSRIRFSGRVATGVDCVGPDGSIRSIDAKYVVVAAGAIETPRLLLLSGFDNPLIGRFLMVHFQTFAVGTFEDDLHAERGRTVTHVHDDAIDGDEATREAAREAGLPYLRGGMVEHGGTGLPIMEAINYPWGRRHVEAMRNSALRRRLWALTMQGEDLSYATNAVDLDPAIKDARGFPVARVTYSPGRHELAAHRHHGPRLEAILKAMGAQWTTVASSPGASHERGRPAAVPESRHVMGTTRMGIDPRRSVVDQFGMVHGMDNVVVADSSVFVTSAGYGPTLTLVALAARAASHIAGVGTPGGDGGER